MVVGMGERYIREQTTIRANNDDDSFGDFGGDGFGEGTASVGGDDFGGGDGDDDWQSVL
jgi:hypothetical protein